ncbi:MAG: MBL fold metallo-hydrolase [Ruminococcus sp.]|nr:MBL fold metallo-hydrolase [Ruminococcus sp.]
MKRLVSLIICVILAFSLLSCELNTPPTTYSNTPLSVHFIDVGQGDCTLLESNGEFVLIDSGEKEYFDAVCSYLKENGVTTLKYVIATHPHTDHIGCMKEVINTFECENFITPETDCSTKTWLNVLNAVDKNDVNFIDPKVGDTYNFGESDFTIMGPASSFYEDYNDYSVVTKVRCSTYSFLLMGDAENQAERDILDTTLSLKADVLKVGHHGSKTSTTPEFLEAVDPDYAVISCGKNNEYGHPHTEILSLLDDFSVKTYRTDELSTIIARVKNFDNKAKLLIENTDSKSLIENTENDETIKEESFESSKYIGNKKSMKFHYHGCQSVDEMKPENKVALNNRDEAINNGYAPCKICNP